MVPTQEQVEISAYHRWQKRGYLHGLHQEDWQASERDLTFGLNYRWAVRYAGQSSATVEVGKPASPSSPRLCRFCEQAAPRARFGTTAWTIPASFGNTSLVSWDECDECRAAYDAHPLPAFEAFAAPLLAGADGREEFPEGVPVPALKALVRMGLALLPAAELHHFDDATEWVTNPDADRDAALLAGLGAYVYQTRAAVPGPFASLARRSDDDAPFPYMLVFLGTGHTIFQAALPFSPRDEDLPEDSLPPLLSMSGGPDHRPSLAHFLTLDRPEPIRPRNGTPRHAGLRF